MNNKEKAKKVIADALRPSFRQAGGIAMDLVELLDDHNLIAEDKD